MGRYLSSVSGGASSASLLAGSTGTIGAGFLGVFGSGLYRIFYSSGAFTVPAEVTAIRVRAFGAGGSPYEFLGDLDHIINRAWHGGGGGGYAHGIANVSPGATLTVNVSRADQIGEATYITGINIKGYAGAHSTASAPGAGGEGVGGSFQARGGSGGLGAPDSVGLGPGGGGGGAGSQLGNGGNGGKAVPNTVDNMNVWRYGGGGGVGGNAGDYAGGSAFGAAHNVTPGPDILGSHSPSSDNPINAICRFPCDCFTGGGARYEHSAGPGGGGYGRMVVTEDNQSLYTFTEFLPGVCGGYASGWGGSGNPYSHNGLLIIEW